MALLDGCATYGDYSVNSSSVQPISFNSSQKLFVAEPPNFTGVRDADVARLVAMALANAARKQFAGVEMADSHEDHQVNLTHASALHCDLLIQPQILVWQDNATEWSGNPDRIEFEIELFDVASGKLLSSIDLRNSSGFLTPIGFKPQDLLAQTFDNFFSGKTSTPTPRPASNPRSAGRN